MSEQVDRNRGRTTGSTLWLLIAAVLIALAIPAGWWTTDVLEADNDFCNSCHLPDGSPLHTDLRTDFDARPAASLAAHHGSLLLASRPSSPNIRCIDCHGGVGLIGRARVKLLSVKDTLLYLSGRFDEPDGMTSPLSDEDCSQCHAQFREKGEGFDGEAFHNKTLHNVGLGVDCVDCHAVHDADGDPERWFLRDDLLSKRCAQCHVEYNF